jgi:hypothetical protein
MNTDVLKSNMLSLAAGPLPTLPNPCDTIPDSKQILFFEAYQESGDAFTDERISFDQSSAAMLRYWTNWDSVSDTTLAQILRSTLIGGQYVPTGGSPKKVTPQVHPYLPGLFCKDIVSVQSVACGPQDFAGITKPIPFQLALLTLSYTSRPYLLGASPGYDNGNQYNKNWVELQVRSANQHITTPFGIWVFDSSSPVPPNSQGKPAQLGNFLTQGITYITFIFHDVLHSQLYGSGIIPQFAGSLGHVNGGTFFGLPAETVLADTSTTECWGDYFNPSINHYDVTVNFIYNSFGWNTTPDYSGTFSKIHFAGAAGVRPYLTDNFLSSIFNTLNPP